MLKLRESQVKAWKTLKDVQCGILNAPTGWGKSLTLCTLVADRPRVILAIPQRVIAKGFVKKLDITLPNGRLCHYEVTHNMCEAIGRKLELLRDWITSDNEGIIVTTHQALARLWGDLDEDEKQAATTNTCYVIDEAHHVHSGDDAYNQLGAMVRYILDEGVSPQLLLATAFFFRGDEMPIVPDEAMERFERYFVPFDEWWAMLKHLKRYRYDFLAYKGTPWKEIETLLKLKDEPTLFFVPWEGHRLFLGKGKERFVQRLISIIEKHTGASVWKGGIPKRGERVILDLTREDYRNEKVKFAFEHGDRIAAIITVGMFREGADWEQCSRVIDIIPSNSNQDRMQRFGRLIRDFPGKSEVAYYSLFPHITDHTKEKQREELTRLYTHFHASLVLENALTPIKIPVPPSRKGIGQDATGRPENLLSDYDLATQENILNDVHLKLINLAEQQGSVEASQAESAVRGVLSEYGIKKHQPQMARQIVLMLRRAANPNLPVNELVKAGFDKVWHSDALQGLTLFSAGVGGPTNFIEIRRIITSVMDSKWLETYEGVKTLPCKPKFGTRANWWCANQRQERRNGTLSAERTALLEQISWWFWSEGKDEYWNRRFEEVKALTKSPARTEYPQLDQWVQYQKRNRKSLTKQKQTQLESIPWWTWGSLIESNWKQKFERVAQCTAMPTQNKHLRDWISHQRANYRNDVLTKEQIKQLESIPWWSWDRRSDQFEKMLAACRKHKKRPPQYPLTKESRSLWNFIYYQRKQRHKLPKERRKKLESLSWWEWTAS